MNSELVLGGDYYVGDLVVGQEQRVGTIKIDGITYNRYVKIIDFGALPDNASKTVAHGITGVVGWLNCKVTATSNVSTAGITIAYSTNTAITCYCNSSYVYVDTMDNYSTRYTSSYAMLEYYK